MLVHQLESFLLRASQKDKSFDSTVLRTYLWEDLLQLLPTHLIHQNDWSDLSQLINNYHQVHQQLLIKNDYLTAAKLAHHFGLMIRLYLEIFQNKRFRYVELGAFEAAATLYRLSNQSALANQLLLEACQVALEMGETKKGISLCHQMIDICWNERHNGQKIAEAHDVPFEDHYQEIIIRMLKMIHQLKQQSMSETVHQFYQQYPGLMTVEKLTITLQELTV